VRHFNQTLGGLVYKMWGYTNLEKTYTYSGTNW
jgi:hypothetical protein